MGLQCEEQRGISRACPEASQAARDEVGGSAKPLGWASKLVGRVPTARTWHFSVMDALPRRGGENPATAHVLAYLHFLG